MAKYDLTAEEARRHISYHPDTGTLTRISGPRKGSICRPEKCRGGYLVLKLLEYSYFGHELAWLLHYGKWPKYQIDHIDRDRSNTRIENLRDVSQSVNVKNWVSDRGYRPVGNRYQARVYSHGKWRSVGCYATAEEARTAYLKEKHRLLALFLSNEIRQDSSNP